MDKNPQKVFQGDIKLNGVCVFTVSRVENEQDRALENDILFAIEQGIDAKQLIEEFNKRRATKVVENKNVVVSTAHNMIADHLMNVSPTNDMKINYGALGTGNTSPTTSDTTLETESYRKKISSISTDDNVVHVSIFYSSTEVDGTFYEHAFFSDASETTDSGVMINRVLIDDPTGITKSTSETLTIDYTLTIS